MDYNLVSKELLLYLEEMFPNKLPPKDTSQAELYFLQGQQSVIERLKQLYEDDNGWEIGTSNS
jgi:hypothetical protein|tara:strand:- start:4280 stop:4468 length:189 start_codon:yes stop_codon:yes gene_type:complete